MNGSYDPRGTNSRLAGAPRRTSDGCGARFTAALAISTVALLCAAACAPARADEAIPEAETPATSISPLPVPRGPAPEGAVIKPQRFNVYLQSTITQQYHGYFASAYAGPQSMSSSPDTAKTFDATLFAGARLGEATELYLNAELDQGFGLGQPPAGPGQAYSGTYGVAGYVTGESYKLGSDRSYGRVQRAFVRQTFAFGGGSQSIDPDINQLGGSTSVKHLIVTAGKFNVTDVFDTNPYAHDPKNDFLNWSIIDMGSLDYPGDAWGYTAGISAELSNANSTLRAGLFQMSSAPASIGIEERPLAQHGQLIEFEQRTSFFGGRPGSYKALIYGDTGFMGAYADAVDLGLADGANADASLVRRKHTKVGGGINIAQEIAPHVGAFARVSAMNGSYETFDSTDIDRSISTGVSIDGGLYHRPNDAIGLAGVVNGLSNPAKRYFADGGLGLVIGDGGLKYGAERIFETYYKFGISKIYGVTFDYQFIDNPGYNTVRGPISVFGMRYHTQI